jgi:hypothetical protein
LHLEHGEPRDLAGEKARALPHPLVLARAHERARGHGHGGNGAAGPRLTARSSNRARGRAGGGGKEPRAHPGSSCGVGVVGGARELANSSPEVLGGRRLLGGVGVVVGARMTRLSRGFDEGIDEAPRRHGGEAPPGRWPRLRSTAATGCVRVRRDPRDREAGREREEGERCYGAAGASVAHLGALEGPRRAAVASAALCLPASCLAARGRRRQGVAVGWAGVG